MHPPPSTRVVSRTPTRPPAALVDPAARWTVDAATQATASSNTPFQGRTLTSRVVATFLRGRATVLDGVAVPLAEPRAAR